MLTTVILCTIIYTVRLRVNDNAPDLTRIRVASAATTAFVAPLDYWAATVALSLAATVSSSDYAATDALEEAHNRVLLLFVSLNS